MFELTINGEIYKFNFGMGFLKEIQAQQHQEYNGAKLEVGLRFAILGLVQGDPVSLWNILNLGNKYAQDSLRLNLAVFESFMDGMEDDSVFETVLDFLAQKGCTRKLTRKVLSDLNQEQNQ